MDNIACSRCSVRQIVQFRRCIFTKNENIFRHLKLYIGLAIPDLNDEKYNRNNSGGEELKSDYMIKISDLITLRFKFHKPIQN